MLKVVTDQWTKAALAQWIEQRAVRRQRLELREFFLDLSYDELQEKLISIADSWRSGGTAELTAIVSDASVAIPVLGPLALVYQGDRAKNEQAIHYIQLLCALHRIAEERGYDW